MRPDPSHVLYHTLNYAVCSGHSWEESGMSGMVTFPKLMSYCSKLSWGRPTYFFPKAQVQVTQVSLWWYLILNALILSVRHSLSIHGVVWCALAVSLDVSHLCTAFGKASCSTGLYLCLTRKPQRCGDARADERYLWKGKPFLILILGNQNLPHCRKLRYDSQ